MQKVIKRTLLIAGFVVLGGGAARSQEEMVDTVYLEEVAPTPDWVSVWEEARRLAGQGDYLEAKRLYESLLEEPASLGSQVQTIREEYEALRVNLLFSPLETPDSFFHTIEPGDSLYELAKKYNTTVALLRKSNGIKGDTIIAGKKLKIPKSEFSIVIQKRRNRLTLLADGEPFKHYKVATGTDGSTPAGSFKIVNKLENPTWYHAGAVVPPDSPDNILGTRWLGFDTPGYGIHGTTLPETIGTQSSKGCVRMLNEDVEELYDIVPVGTDVVVKG
jgi:lipoprotein-anchoring transpeptidase ErfK/SrfK